MSLTPDQRFPDHFGFVSVREMPQEPLSCLFVNKGGKRRVIPPLPKMQIDQVRAMLDTSLERRRIFHFFPPERNVRSARAEWRANSKQKA